jgi:hypothetical protein
MMSIDFKGQGILDKSLSWCLLQAPGLHWIEDGAELEDNKGRSGTAIVAAALRTVRVFLQYFMRVCFQTLGFGAAFVCLVIGNPPCAGNVNSIP